MQGIEQVQQGVMSLGVSLPHLLGALLTMPTLVINSNVPSDRVEHSDLLSALSKAIAEATGKPEQVRDIYQSVQCKCFELELPAQLQVGVGPSLA